MRVKGVKERKRERGRCGLLSILCLFTRSYNGCSRLFKSINIL